MNLKDIVKLVLGRGRGAMLKVGEAAPEFDVEDHSGQRRRLSDYRGKTVVLWFFPKADTPG